MKKFLLFIFSLFCLTQLVGAEGIGPELEVKLGPIPATQKAHSGEKVVALNLWLTPINHQSGNITINKITILHEGDDKNQFIQYTLLKNNKVLARVTSSISDAIDFSNLEITLVDGKTVGLEIDANITQDNVYGTHYFSIPDGNAFILKSKPGDGDTMVTGNFPIKSNKILIAEKFDIPEMTKDCNMREEPVCGEDGKTYYNLCIPFQKGITLLHHGQCEEQEQPKICSKIQAPVCGEDQVTYANECQMQNAKVEKKYDGECFPTPFTEPTLFSQAVQLFDVKNNEIQQLKPGISNDTKNKLDEISSVLHNYPFLENQYKDLILKISDFLDFAQNPSSSIARQQEINTLNAAIIDARTSSAKQKLDQGKISFLDVDEDAWFFGPVQSLEKENLITDFYDQGSFIDQENQIQHLFEPEAYVTKAQFTKLLLDLMNQTEEYTKVQTPPQNPLGQNHWAKNVIAYSEKQGFTMWKNFPNPNKRVSRAEAIQLILEILNIKNLPDGPATPSFTDVPRSSEFFRSVEYAKKIGFVNGYEDKTFKPDNSVHRGEAAKLAVSAYNLFLQKK